jgi:hypothetical protein
VSIIVVIISVRCTVHPRPSAERKEEKKEEENERKRRGQG